MVNPKKYWNEKYGMNECETTENKLIDEIKLSIVGFVSAHTNLTKLAAIKKWTRKGVIEKGCKNSTADELNPRIKSTADELNPYKN